MKTLDIFRTLEKQAIEWGNAHNEFKVGDIVESHLPQNKKPRLFVLSSIQVFIGRNAQKTIYKSLTLRCVGRRLKKDGTCFDVVGSGIYLGNFTRLADGKTFEANHNGVNQVINDGGLVFNIDCDQEAKKLYPNAHETYADGKGYPYAL